MKALVLEHTRSFRAMLQDLLRPISASSAAQFGVWRMPGLLRYAVVVALFLPGSFAVLPLIWLWQRRNGARTR